MKFVYFFLLLMGSFESHCFAALDEAHTSYLKIPNGSKIVFQWDKIISEGQTSIFLADSWIGPIDDKHSLSCLLSIPPSRYLRTIQGSLEVAVSPGVFVSGGETHAEYHRGYGRIGPFYMDYFVSFGNAPAHLECTDNYFVSLESSYSELESQYPTILDLRNLLAKAGGTLVLANPKPF